MDWFVELMNIDSDESIPRKLTHDAIYRGIRCLTSNCLKTNKFQELLLRLIPQDPIPEGVIKPLLLWFFEYYPQQITNCKLVLHWIIGLIEYNLINKKVIASFYFCFLPLIQNDSFRPLVCKLLYILTDISDVRRWLVEQVLEVHNKTGKNKSTGALLNLYKSMRPDCIPENIKSVAISKAFPQFPRKVSEVFKNANYEVPDLIFENHFERTPVNTPLIPPITYKIIQSTVSRKKKIPITSCKNIVHLTKKQFLFEMPSNVISLITSAIGRHILTFSSSVVKNRLSYYLYHLLYYELFENEKNMSLKDIKQVLEYVLFLNEYALQGVPIMGKILEEYLYHKWDGSCDVQLFQLITWLNFKSYTHLENFFLNPLVDKLITSDPTLAQMLVITVMRFIENIFIGVVYRVVNNMSTPFEYKLEWSLYETMYELCEWASNFCETAVKIHGSCVLSTTLFFFENLEDLQSKSGLGLWTVPRPLIAYTCLFSVEVQHISWFCALLLKYKDLKNLAQDRSEQTKIVRTYAKDYMNCFSSVYIDQSFTLAPPLPRHLRKKLGKMKPGLNLISHIAFIPYLLEFLNKNMDVNEQVAEKVANTFYPRIMEFINNFQ